MSKADEIIDNARKQGRTVLTEIESKQVVKEAGVNVVETRRIKGCKVGVCPKGYAVQSNKPGKVKIPSKVGLKKYKCREYKSEESAKRWRKEHKRRGRRPKRVGRYLRFKKSDFR